VSHVLDANFNSGAGLAAMPGVLTLTTAQLPQALSVLSGDSTSVTQTAALTTGGLFASMLTERAATRRADELACVGGDAFAADACAPPPDWSAWASGFGATQWLKPNTTTGNASTQQTIGGGAAGGDYRIAPDTLIGFAIGISESNFSVPDRSASGWATGGHLGVYALQNLGDFYVNGALSYRPRRQQHDPRHRRHRHHGNRQRLVQQRPTRRPGRGRSSLRVRRLRRDSLRRLRAASALAAELYRNQHHR